MTYSTAAQTCDRLVNSIVVNFEYILRKLPQVAPLFQVYIARANEEEGWEKYWGTREYLATVSGLTEEIFHEVKFTAADMGVVSLWRRHRTIYDFDPSLWAELKLMEPDAQIPEGLFGKLPHSDPFVALPGGVLLPLADGKSQKLTGFFVCGQVEAEGGYVQASTHSPAATQIGILVAGEVQNADGTTHSEDGVLDVLWTRLTLVVKPGRCTIVDLVEQASSKFVATGGEDDWEGDLPLMLQTCVSALVYLCSKNADLRPEPAPPPARVGKRGGRTRREAPRHSLVKVGYRIGAQLRAYRRSAAGRLPGAETGRVMPPHVRRAHLHTYRVGPGREGFEVRWISPVPINMTAAPKVSTVHGVRKRRAGKS